MENIEEYQLMSKFERNGRQRKIFQLQFALLFLELICEEFFFLKRICFNFNFNPFNIFYTWNE